MRDCFTHFINICYSIYKLIPSLFLNNIYCKNSIIYFIKNIAKFINNVIHYTDSLGAIFLRGGIVKIHKH